MQLEQDVSPSVWFVQEPGHVELAFPSGHPPGNLLQPKIRTLTSKEVSGEIVHP